VINSSLVADGFLFATHRDRALYLRESARERPQWLKENKGKWRLADVSAGDSSTPHEPAPATVPPVIDAPLTASIAETEIEIGARRYVSAQRVASMLGVSARTLSRWDAARIGPPKIKIGKLVLFDLGKLTEWLASRETTPAPAAGRNTQGGSDD
jgi:predicted DNA-binding transcriptional regulator AlpA